MNINVQLVKKLIATQFPQWRDLPVNPVEVDGWDNRTFRLGENLSVRLPSAAAYREQVAKEHQWLPVLSPLLPLPIPTPMAMGSPDDSYPWHWSVYGWLEGEQASPVGIDDLPGFAACLAEFLTALRGIDATGGPVPGRHNFFRGGSLTVYDAQTRSAIENLNDHINSRIVTEIWEEGLRAAWQGSPVWVHGDVSAGNLLVSKGKLAAVIDFGCCAVGDPACDLVIAWTLFSGDSRDAFRDTVAVDKGTWARARGWALWKALITLAEYMNTDQLKAADAKRVIDDLLIEHEQIG